MTPGETLAFFVCFGVPGKKRSRNNNNCIREKAEVRVEYEVGTKKRGRALMLEQTHQAEREVEKTYAALNWRRN